MGGTFWHSHRISSRTFFAFSSASLRSFRGGCEECFLFSPFTDWIASYSFAIQTRLPGQYVSLFSASLFIIHFLSMYRVPEPLGLGEVQLRLGMVALLQVGIAPVVVHHSIIRRQPNSFSVIGDREFQVA